MIAGEHDTTLFTFKSSFTGSLTRPIIDKLPHPAAFFLAFHNAKKSLVKQGSLNFFQTRIPNNHR